MAICDYCGGTYRGGAVKDGVYRYCNVTCSERGRYLLARLSRVSQSEIDQEIAVAHAEPCQCCGKSQSVDVYWSYRIWSALIYAGWRTDTYILCQWCAKKRQARDLMFCLAAGWWSPHGFLITPFMLIFNVIALLKRCDPAIPSRRFRKYITINIARQLPD